MSGQIAKKDIMRNGRPKTETVGFGFEPEGGAYHFVVTIPAEPVDVHAMVTVAEHFAYGESVEEAAARARFTERPNEFVVRPPRPKVELRYALWQAIAEDVRAEFNRRLLGKGQKTSQWRPGDNVVAPYLGKELVLLLWAIEEAQLAEVRNAYENWRGLVPEERWWLYTTINASTGHVSEGRGRGWRKAIRIAFIENPVTDTPGYFNQPVAPSNTARPTPASRNGRGKKKKAETDDTQPTLLNLNEQSEDSN